MSELAVITSYFNPCRYQTRRTNYDLFRQGMRQASVPCLTIECAFGDDAFELPDAIDIIRVRCTSVLWQKERLLNLAASHLPKTCKYVAWFDCDILFENQNWTKDLLQVLNTHRIAQVFETCLRTTRGNVAGSPPDIARSFASVVLRDPSVLSVQRYDAHGHTGYGWAMHRAIFDVLGLYEAAVSGSADHFMAHAIFGACGFCIHNALKRDHKQIEHFSAWAQRFHRLVQGSLGVVPGQIRHLWHGDTINRRYFLRMHDITDLGYDPWSDLVSVPGRALEWHPAMEKPKLKQYFHNYFLSRQEDGAESQTQ